MWDAMEGAVEKEPENTEIFQGFLEMSNASVVKEMVNMITISRQYESNQKMLTTFDETLEKTMTLSKV